MNVEAMPITVAIVEDDAEIRETLTRVVRRAPRLSFLRSFSRAEEALEELPALAPDVVVMDIQLPGMNGIQATARVKTLLPKTQILVLTVFGDSDQVFRALEAGANGYLLKRSSRQEIVEAIEQVRAGCAPMSGEIARKVVELLRKPTPRAGDLDQRLTPREEEVLGLLAKGFVTKEIADHLQISGDTVRFHLKHIYSKLHVRSRTEALLRYLG